MEVPKYLLVYCMLFVLILTYQAPFFFTSSTLSFRYVTMFSAGYLLFKISILSAAFSSWSELIGPGNVIMLMWQNDMRCCMIVI